MFLIDIEQKKSFLRSLYSLFMDDKLLTAEEQSIIEIIQKELFKIDEFDRTDLVTAKKIAQEVKNVGDENSIYYLFKVASSSTSSKNKVDFFQQVVDELDCSSLLKDRINSIAP